MRILMAVRMVQKSAHEGSYYKSYDRYSKHYKNDEQKKLKKLKNNQKINKTHPVNIEKHQK
jgi:hypothetical protein